LRNLLIPKCPASEPQREREQCDTNAQGKGQYGTAKTASKVNGESGEERKDGFIHIEVVYLCICYAAISGGRLCKGHSAGSRLLSYALTDFPTASFRLFLFSNDSV
jgi:hypothetical protein